MRPVDLTPSGERRGRVASRRTGFASYLLVGLLVAALAGAGALVVTQRKVSDREDEVVELTRTEAAARARADSLQLFADFQALAQARQATVTSLATSRFDWERVMRELSLVLPSDVWLTDLIGSVTPGVAVEGGVDVPTRAAVPGPALEMAGCATGQAAVAGFISALEDIDGVTRVGVNSASRPDGGVSASGASDGDCRTRDSIVRFEILVAFDAVPPPTSVVPTAPAPTAPTSARAEERAARASIKTQTAKADEAIDRFVPGS
jgi:Tfp pilus assembly protein PilN